MRRHLWMHAGLLVAVLAVLGLDALGVAIPIAVVYLIALACPVMLITMLLGIGMGNGSKRRSAPTRSHHDDRHTMNH